MDGDPVDLQAGSGGVVGRGEGVGSCEHLGVGRGGRMVEGADARGGVQAAAELVVRFAGEGCCEVSPLPSGAQSGVLCLRSKFCSFVAAGSMQITQVWQSSDNLLRIVCRG